MSNYIYVKQNDEPIEIECVKDEHDEEKDFIPSFWWYGRRYYLEDFIRCHNNPWVYDEFPDFVHGYYEDYIHPVFFIELIEDLFVNIYKEEEI